MGRPGIDADYVLSQRNLPAPGFKPAALVIGMGAVCVWGFYKLGQGIREQKYVSPPITISLPRVGIPTLHGSIHVNAIYIQVC